MKAAGWLWLALLASGCRSMPGLREAAVLEDRDFVYTIALSPDATQAAFTHLGAKSFQLGLWSLEPLARVADVPINPNAFDVEGLAFSPDGQAVCAASRDGVLRCYAAKDGAALGAYAADGPLVSVAFHPGGRAVLLGGAGGLVTVLEWPGLRFASDARVHGAEVRAVAVARDGRVFTGGWDKSIAVSELVERSEAVRTARAGVAPGPARKVLALEERARFAFPAYVNDLTVDREGRVLGVAFSGQKAERTREIYEREKRREPAPRSALDCSAMVDARTGQVMRAWHAHLGIVATAAISPDGRRLVTGGWDKALYLLGESATGPLASEELGWSLRRARFSEDGRLVAVGAWTPQGTGGGRSAPSALLYAPSPGADGAAAGH